MSEEEKMAVEQEEILVETPDDAPAEKEQPASDRAEASSGEAGEELDSYSKGVQSRIKKLTEKYRQEERDKAEAVRLSQQLMQENQALKGRVQALDTGYLSEYGTRLQTQTESAKRQYKEAYESGDTDRMLEAQQMLSNIAVEQQRYNTAKTRAEQQAQQRQAAPQQQAQAAPQQQQQQPRPKPDPRAESWASKNTWFGQDKIMTNAAYTLHHQLIEDEGFDPEADEYYNELDKRLRQEFPHKFQAKKTGGGSQVASAGNSASRSTKQGRRSVKLSHSQVAIAKKLGVPLEEYAKFVKD